MKSLLPLAAAAALSLGFAAPAAAKMTPLGTVGGWNISANDKFCMGSADYENGTSLTFSIYADGEAVVIVSNSDWEIPRGRYPVVSWVDRLEPYTFQGNADGKFVSHSWKLNESSVSVLSNGSTFHVKIGQTEYQFSLSGSAAMLRSVGQCVTQRLGGAYPSAEGTTTSAPVSPANPFPKTASNPYRRM